MTITPTPSICKKPHIMCCTVSACGATARVWPEFVSCRWRAYVVELELHWGGGGRGRCGFVSCNDVMVYPGCSGFREIIISHFAPGSYLYIYVCGGHASIAVQWLRLECRSHDFIIVCASWREPDPCSWHGTVAAPSSAFFGARQWSTHRFTVYKHVDLAHQQNVGSIPSVDTVRCPCFG